MTYLKNPDSINIEEALNAIAYFNENPKPQIMEQHTALAKNYMVALAALAPGASIGQCHCGEPLRFKGKSIGLFACCTGRPEHCWKVA